ncbi:MULTISPECIES: hypothetical protein [unclassified Uliginosibacterium]|nr:MULTISPECIES: hypothetical protein [unclassified Uliginosibacterium]MDO6388407.1 hypothetical protein [Uliginosibacterium sp. 31-12]
MKARTIRIVFNFSAGFERALPSAQIVGSAVCVTCRRNCNADTMD